MTKYALPANASAIAVCTPLLRPASLRRHLHHRAARLRLRTSWPESSLPADFRLHQLPHSDGCSSATSIPNSPASCRKSHQHKVSNQWWGHAVGWASYHDQWLSEGFADFPRDCFCRMLLARIGRARLPGILGSPASPAILEKNNFGVAPNDAGRSGWACGWFLHEVKNAYQNVTYPKGAYVLQMLKSQSCTARTIRTRPSSR